MKRRFRLFDIFNFKDNMFSETETLTTNMLAEFMAHGILELSHMEDQFMNATNGSSRIEDAVHNMELYLPTFIRVAQAALTESDDEALAEKTRVTLEYVKAYREIARRAIVPDDEEDEDEEEDFQP